MAIATILVDGRKHHHHHHEHNHHHHEKADYHETTIARHENGNHHHEKPTHHEATTSRNEDGKHQPKNSTAKIVGPVTNPDPQTMQTKPTNATAVDRVALSAPETCAEGEVRSNGKCRTESDF